MSSYLKLPEVAHRLGVSEKTARRYIKSGVLPSVFVGNSYRVNPDTLTEFVERSHGGHSVKEVSSSQKATALSSEPASVTALPDAEERIDYREVYFEKRREHLALLEEIIAEAGEVMGTEDYEEFIELPSDEQHRRLNYAERLTNLVHKRLKHFDDDDLPEELEHKVTHLRTTVEEFKKSA